MLLSVFDLVPTSTCKADADNLEAVKATLRGLKLRHDKTGEVPVYIHTVRQN